MNEVDVCLSSEVEGIEVTMVKCEVEFEGTSMIMVVMMNWCIQHLLGSLEILLSILLQYRRSQRLIASSSNVIILLVGHGRSRDKEQLEEMSSRAEEEHALWASVTPST